MKNFKTIYKALGTGVRSHHIVQYAILRGMTYADDKISASTLIDHYISKAFTPVRRKARLENGHNPNLALINALTWARMNLNNTWKHSKPWTVLDQDPKAIFDTDAEIDQFKTELNRLWDRYYIPDTVSNSRKYVYIFVRQDISPEYQLVQVAHAAAKMGHRQGDMNKPDFDALYFTAIGVPSELALMKAEEELKAKGLDAYVFREPDIGDQITAIASSPVLMKDRKGLLAYKKLRFV